MRNWAGYIGLAAFALAWIPQSWDTIRRGRCDVNGAFLFLAALGSFSLTIHATILGDWAFLAVNALTTLGAIVNMGYKLRSRWK